MLKYLMLAVTLLLVSVASCSWVDRTSTTIKNEIGSELSTTKEEVASLNIGIVQGIYCDSPYNGHYIYVLIEPNNAEANQTYIVSLYEKGQFRQMNTISWNQPEINIKKAKLVSFNASDEEFSAYYPEYRLPLLDIPEGIIKQREEALYQTKSLSSVFSAIITSEESSSSINEISQPELKLERLRIEPKQVSINEPITITVWQINETVEKKSIVITLKINGQVEQTQVTKNCPRQYNPQGCRVVFTVTKAQSGTYTVDIGGVIGSFTVK